MRIAALLALLAACKDDAASTDDTVVGCENTPWFIDADGDGYGSDNPDYIVFECDPPPGFVDNDDDCDDLDAARHEGTIWHQDLDGDGYGDPAQTRESCEEPSGFVLDDTDCDDTDPAINPNTLWYRDADQDGYGYPSETQRACEEPSGYSADGRDCNDLDPAIYPGAPEICDDRDNDCDGRYDADAIDAPTWYPDGDADGFGALEGASTSCDQPSGTVGNADDCEDADPEIHPDAEEICNDNLDNDCDGVLGPCVEVADAADIILTGESAGDTLGRSLSSAGDADGDGSEDYWFGAPYADIDGTDSGAAYLILGPLSPGVHSAATRQARLSAEEGDLSGAYVSGGQDLSGDGLPDVVLSAHRSDALLGSQQGTAYVFFGPLQGDLGPADAAAEIYGETRWQRLSQTARLSADITGDGQADLVLGAPYYPSGATNTATGAIYLVPGPIAAGTAGEVSGVAGWTVTGESASDGVGAILELIDLNGDGVEDLVVGGRENDANGAEAGAVYAVYGGDWSGEISLFDADLRLLGLNSGDALGQSLANARDVDGDGVEDLLVGAAGYDHTGTNLGAAYLVPGGASSGLIDAAAMSVLYGQDSNDSAGNAVGGGGDVDGDGVPDLLVSASTEGLLDEGAVYLVYGPPAPTVDLASAAARFDGEQAYDELGGNARLLPDVSGTRGGLYDVALSSVNNDRGGSDAGAVWFILGVGL